MNIGNLNTRCSIEQKVTAQDANYGTETVTWTTLAVVWCNVQDVLPSRSESVRHGLAVALNQTRWRARYRTDLDSSMRIVIDRPARTVYGIVAGPAVIGNKELIECIIEKVSL